METKLLEDWQQRVVDEYSELVPKVKRLRAFIRTNTSFPNLPQDERLRMQRQRIYMGLYAGVLAERIAAWDIDHDKLDLELLS